MSPFMRDVLKIVKENKSRRREAFLKAKKDEKKGVFSIFRPKRNNVYKKTITQRKKI